MRKAALIVALLFGVMIACACSTTPSIPNPTAQIAGQPAVIVRVLDETLEPYAIDWQAEIARRLPNSCAIFVHGGDKALNVWVCHTDTGWRLAADVVREYQAAFPDRTIVLLSCNPGHYKLGIPGVYYAKSSVWLVPDRSLCYEPDEGPFDLHRMTLDSIIPATQPATRPTTNPFDPSWFPFDLPSIITAFPKPDFKRPTHSRSLDDPDGVGNIFEFVVE